MAKAGAAHHREPLPTGHTLREAPLHGQRGAGPSPSPAKGSHTMTGHPLAKWGAPHWPPTGHLLAIRGGATGQRGGFDWPPDGGSLRPALPRLAT